MKRLCIVFESNNMESLLEAVKYVPAKERLSLARQILLMDKWIKHLHPDAPEQCVVIQSLAWNGKFMKAQVKSSVDHLVPALDMKLLGHQFSHDFDGLILIIKEIYNDGHETL